MVKAKVILKEEDPIQPNPFKKYLEETRDPDTEQVMFVLFPWSTFCFATLEQ